MAKKTGGLNPPKTEKFIKDVLLESGHLYKYEAKIAVKAFKKTIDYFVQNLIEFKIKNFFEFVTFHKKASTIYVPYRKEYITIPEHEDMKFKASEDLKNFLNYRKEFKDSQHKEYLLELKRKKF